MREGGGGGDAAASSKKARPVKACRDVTTAGGDVQGVRPGSRRAHTWRSAECAVRKFSAMWNQWPAS